MRTLVLKAEAHQKDSGVVWSVEIVFAVRQFFAEGLAGAPGHFAEQNIR
ncbi:MAG: hypothetical protein QG575_1768 [Euryarchaeota archaeon]|nr:hypothetical protein [Euryarchaeota archaeon]